MGSYDRGVYLPDLDEVGWRNEINDMLRQFAEVAINPKAAPYGAAFDGVTDDSAAWQAVMADLAGGGAISMPDGVSIYNSSQPLVVPNYLLVKGAGMGASVLKFTGSAGLSYDSAYYVRFQDLSILNTGTADLVTFETGGASECVWDHVELQQDAAAHRILYGADTVVITCQWLHCKFDCSAAATVSPIDFTAAGAWNKNTFEDCWWAADNETAVPFCFVDNTNGGGYNYDNVFSRITVEQTRGGVLKLLSAMGTEISHVDIYDLGGATTGDQFYIGKHSGGLPSRHTLLDQVNRRGGTLGGGLYDIKLEAGGARDTEIRQSNNATLSGFKIDAGDNAGLMLLNMPAGVTVDNAPDAMMQLRDDGTAQMASITLPDTASSGATDAGFGRFFFSNGKLFLQRESGAPLELTTSELTVPDIAGLIAHYDLSDLSTLWKDTARTTPVTTDGDVIKGVTDKGPNAAHLAEATNGPTWQEASLNDLGVAEFNGSNMLLSDSGGAASAAYVGTDVPVTAIYVVQFASVAAKSGVLAWGHTSADNFVDHYCTATASDQSQKRDGSSTATASDIDALLATATPYVLTRKDSGTALSFYRNGAAMTANPVTFDKGALSLDRFLLGALFHTTVSSFLSGWIAEVLLYDSALADADRVSVERYLGMKYGISVA